MPQHTNTTRERIRETLETLHNSLERFNAIQAHINSGGLLCLKDYSFYRRYCLKKDIAPLHVTINREGVPVTYKKTRVSTLDLTNRYRKLLAQLREGHPIESRDYRFLKRYCKRTGAEMPRLKSILLFLEVPENSPDEAKTQSRHPLGWR